MKGDRFEKMATAAFDKAEQIDWKATSWDAETAKLLRKEHAAVVRMVKRKQSKHLGEGVSHIYQGILAALDKRAKGVK